MEVRHTDGDRSEIRIGHHVLVADQPLEAGGSDAGPTPTDMFVASLAACAEFYIQRFLRRHLDSLDGLTVRASAQMSGERPARVTRVDIAIQLPHGTPPELRNGALRAADRCLVRESLRHAPQIELVVLAERVTSGT
ncbi:MAG: OsmC family protein [Chloroflexi bacterium]|nr:OsmC family protein [Chloroflexota bacterium]